MAINDKDTARRKAYYLAHRAEILARVAVRARAKSAEVAAYKREWREKNKAAIAAKKKQRYAAKREAILAWHCADYRANAAAIKARAKRYRDANVAKVRLVRNRCVKAWRAANKEKAAEVVARRRARLLLTRADPVDYVLILSASGGLCGICRRPLDASGTEFDHIVPLARGGTHTQDNIQATHARCNRVKGAKVA